MNESNLLKSIRQQRRESLTSVAKQLNISTTYYYYMEKGERGFTREIKEKLCKILKIKPSEANEIFSPSMFTVSKTEVKK
jgi:transcriptional regulator with XRE-family HTH domain